MYKKLKKTWASAKPSATSVHAGKVKSIGLSGSLAALVQIIYKLKWLLGEIPKQPPVYII
jgi:hypothetical protein